MVAKTQSGLEQVLAAELTALGAADVKVLRRAVSFKGDKTLMYRANLLCRTALRIIVPIFYTTARNADELYRRTYSIRWTDFFSKRNTFAIDCTTSGKIHHHSLFAARKIKDAIADQFRQRHGERPSVNLDHPTLRINVHIQDADVIFALDSSGDSLHRRGYRLEQNEAPLNEVLASGLIQLTGWKGETAFGDLMCGSGTLLIEAAALAMNHAPGLWREHFGFQRWRDFNPDLWESLVADARSKITAPKGKIFGTEIMPRTVEVAKRNFERAGMTDHIGITCTDFRNARPPEGEKPGLLVMNPPYGERIQLAEIDQFYEDLGDTMKKYFQGYEAWIFSGNPEALKKVGLKASKKLQLLNGSIECRYQQYELYAGSRTAVKPAE